MAEPDSVIVIELGVKELVLVAAAIVAIAAGYWFTESLRPNVTVTLDKSEYFAGEVVTIRGVLSGGGSTVGGVDAGIEVRGPASDLIWIDQVMTGSDGSYLSCFRLRDDAQPGEYTVYVSTFIARGTATFRVRK